MAEKAIVYSSDDNYAMQLGISLLSLLMHNSGLDISIYILSYGISEENKRYYKELGKNHQANVTIIDITDDLFMTSYNLSQKNVSSRSAYVRLFLSKILPEDIERVLWIDADTLILDSVHDLLVLDLQENVCGMAIDASSTFKLLNGFARSDLYYNSGVMVIDMKKWRNIVFPSILFEIEKRKGKSIDEDQSYINVVCKGMIATLDPRYNMMHAYYRASSAYHAFLRKQFLLPEETYSFTTFKEAAFSTVIVHFTNYSDSRPWEYGCEHPMKEKWLEYKNMTPWANFPLKKKSASCRGISRMKNSIMHIIYVMPLVRSVFVRAKYGLTI